MQPDICNECGKSVRAGTGLFVNRISDFNDFETRKEMGKPFPNGEYICATCNERLDERKLDAGDKRISD